MHLQQENALLSEPVDRRVMRELQMLARASSRGAAGGKSLLQRLAPLETGIFLATGNGNRSAFDRPGIWRGPSWRACFGLGFAVGCIAGSLIAAVPLLVKPVQAMVATAEVTEHATTIAALPANPLVIERRLWWRLPLSDGDHTPPIGVGGLHSSGVAQLAAGGPLGNRP